jgi:outer membrane protein assembly factor BamB
MNAFSDTRIKTGKTLCLVAGLALLAGCEKELILQGERFNIRAPLSESVAQDGQAAGSSSYGIVENKSVPISIPAARVNAEWTHRSDNAQHLMPNATLSATPVRIWSTSIGKGNSRQNRISAAPIVAEGRVFAMDSGAGLTAVSTSGATLWSVDLTPAGARGPALSGGGIAYGSGRVFAATANGEVVAIDPASGGVVWRQKLGAPAAGAPTVADGMVYVVGRDSTAWAINAKDGKVAWQLAGGTAVTGIVGAGAPVVTSSTVLFPFSTGELAAALKKGGLQLWSASIAGERLGRAYTGITDIAGDPVVDGGVTYVGNQSGRVSAIETATGTVIWSAHEAAYGAVLPVGGSVFLISDEAQLVRLDAKTGEVIWQIEMPYYTTTKEKKRSAITAHYGPVLAGGRLVVATGDGRIRMLNPPKGPLVGSVELPGGAAAAPALAGGVMYVVSGNGQLQAFR